VRCAICGQQMFSDWWFADFCMTPEGKVKEQIKKLLKKYGAYWHMPVQNGMGSPALDFHVCHRGLYLGIEAKAPGKTMTDRQVLTAKEISDAGGIVFTCDGTNLVNLELWLMEAGSGDSPSPRLSEAV
jgi:hypothetical protein